MGEVPIGIRKLVRVEASVLNLSVKSLLADVAPYNSVDDCMYHVQVPAVELAGKRTGPQLPPKRSRIPVLGRF